MKSAIWGPYGWDFFHVMALHYPNEPDDTDKNNMINFIKYFCTVLPCEECCDNFKVLLEENPVDNYTDSKKKLFRFICFSYRLSYGEPGFSTRGGEAKLGSFTDSVFMVINSYFHNIIGYWRGYKRGSFA